MLGKGSLVVIFSVIIVCNYACCAGFTGTGTQVISKEFQNITLEDYFVNHNAAQLRFKCIMDNIVCDKISNLVKEVIPELLLNQCSKCTSSDRERMNKLFDYIQQNYPVEWETMVKKIYGGLVHNDVATKIENAIGLKLKQELVQFSNSSKSSVVPSASKMPARSSNPQITAEIATKVETDSSSSFDGDFEVALRPEMSQLNTSTTQRSAFSKNHQATSSSTFVKFEETGNLIVTLILTTFVTSSFLNLVK